MNKQLRTIACGSLVALAVLLGACSRKETMASKSAAAFREAQTIGADSGSADSDGHQHGSIPAGASEPADHSAHAAATDSAGAAAGMDHGAHATMDHGSVVDRSAHAGANDHTATSHDAATSHTGHTSAPATASHAQHDPQAAHAGHAPDPATTAHAGHGAMRQSSATAAPAQVSVPSSSAEVAAVRPQATLRPDEFDAPAATSVAEAAKASGGGPSAAPATDHSAHESQDGAAFYTCPMHPEVRSATPGKCPKCGMTLVRKEGK